MNINKKIIHLMYAIIIFSFLVVNIRLQGLLKNRSNSNKISNLEKTVILSDSTVKFLHSDSLKHNLVGYISQNDCNTCDEVLITRLNQLNKISNWKNKIKILILSTNDKDIELKEDILSRYHPSFSVNIKKRTNEIIFEEILKTPFVIKYSNEGKILEITQIDINKIDKAFRYFDKLKLIND